MVGKSGGSLVDPKKPTESNWLRSNPDLVAFSQGISPHSSTSTTGSSIFDPRSTGTTVSTVDSLQDGAHNGDGDLANQSRFSVLTLDDAQPGKCLSVDEIIRDNIKQSYRELRNGNGVRFIIDLNGDTVQGFSLNVHCRPEKKVEEGNVKIVAEHNYPKLPTLSISQEPLDDSEVPSPKSTSASEFTNEEVLGELGMNPAAVQTFNPDSSTIKLPEASNRRHKGRSDNLSVTTLRSNTSEEERRLKHVGDVILVSTEYDKTREEKLYALFDPQSSRSWISLDALEEFFLVPREIGQDNNGIQPVEDNECWSAAGTFVPYGKIKLCYRFMEGPSSARCFKAWFLVMSPRDIPYQVILGKDFPDLRARVSSCAFVTLAHPKSEAQKLDDAARAKAAKERKQRLEAEKAQKRSKDSKSSRSGHESSK